MYIYVYIYIYFWSSVNTSDLVITDWPFRVNKVFIFIFKTTTRKKQASKIFWTKTQEYSPFSENNQAFHSIAGFSFDLQRFVREKFHFKKKNPTFRRAGVKWFHFKFSRGLERSVRGVRMGKSGLLERASLANQIQGFTIPDRWDASKKIMVDICRAAKRQCSYVVRFKNSLIIH